MPIQKKRSSSSKNLEEDSSHHHQQQQQTHHQQPQQKQGGRQDEEEDQEEEQVEVDKGDEDGDGEDSDGSPSSSVGDKDEFLFVKLSEIRKEVQCPICLGIIRKTRTVMECLHRFCRECIDKSMRLGNNECPACRTHCASRRSLRDDPNYDALIATLYPDIDKYEEKELTFGDEEKTRNKHIQASIAQIFQRQSEALGKKGITTKTMRKSQGNHRRGRSRKNQVPKLEGSDDEANGNSNWGGRDSSSDNEDGASIKLKRCKRSKGLHSSQPSSASTNADVGCHDLEVSRESTDASPVTIGKPEVPVWGRGGTRSQTRHGSASGGNGKDVQSSRLIKLVDYLRTLEENDDEA